MCLLRGCILKEVKYNALSVKMDAGSLKEIALLATPSEMPGFWKGLQELLKPGGRLIRIFPVKASQFFSA